MRLNLIYFSPTGNTGKIVRAVAAGMKEGGAELIDEVARYNLTKERLMDRHEFGSEDIVVVGIPVYAGRISLLLDELFKGLKSNGAYFLPLVTYGNRAVEEGLLELFDIFKFNGFKPLGYGEFIGEHSYSDKVGTGRPDANDIKTAEEYGRMVIERAVKGEVYTGEVPGNRPYRERMPSSGDWGPVTSDKCTFCGRCIMRCPADAIDHLNPKKIDYFKCIHCCSCIKGCPEKAKKNEGEFYEAIKEKLETNFTARKENVLR